MSASLTSITFIGSKPHVRSGKLASYCTPYSTATLILSLAISILGSSTPSRRVTVDIETFTSGGTNGLAQFPNRTIGNPSSGVSQLVLQKYVSQYDIKTGGPAWTFDETTQQYYLHKYDSSQPDINWECQELREGTSISEWEVELTKLSRP